MRFRENYTSPALRLREALDRSALRYRWHRRDLADLVFPGSQVTVLLGGDMWHGQKGRGDGA